MAKFNDIWYTDNREEIERYKYIIMLDLEEKELIQLSHKDKVVERFKIR